MNDVARQKLFEIVTKHGASVIESPRRCEGLLRDYAGKFRREVSVLTMAVEERVPLDLLAAAKSTPRVVLLGRLAQRLCDNLALSETAARWAVNSWAVALGFINDAELKAIERENNGQIQTANTLSTKAQPRIKTVPPTGQLPPLQDKPQNKFQLSGQQTAKAQAIQKSVVVSSNGSGDFSSIGEALKTVAPNTRLIVRPGFYNENLVVDKNVEVVGDGAAGEITVASNSSSCLQMLTDKAVIRGLTFQGRGAEYGESFFAIDVRRGELILENCDISSDSLSCVAIHGVDANPTIKNCRIHDGADSGVYFFDNARGVIESCDIFRNANVGAAITDGANPTMKNCRVFDGGNGGIVAWQNGAAGLIEDCEIFGHRLANIGVSEYANPAFRRCEIYGSMDAGVLVQQKGYGVFEECHIYSNEDAEVAVSTGGNPVLRRCVVHGGRNSGVTARDKGRGLLENCNIYDNQEAGVSVDGESVIAIRRCNIHRNGTVAVRVKGKSAASIEGCDLRGNRIAAWETEYGVTVERKNNRD